MDEYLYHLYSRLAHFLKVGVRIVTRYVTAHVRNVQKQYYAIILVSHETKSAFLGVFCSKMHIRKSRA